MLIKALNITKVLLRRPKVNNQITGASPTLWTRFQERLLRPWESSQWLLSSDIFKIPETLITPMNMPIMPPWANDQDIAHPQAKMVPINLIWSEST